MDLTINNVTKNDANLYSVDFSSLIFLTDLFYEVSADGNTWSSPIEISTSSPQNINVIGMVNFQLRLSTNYTPTPPYSRIHSSEFTETFN